MPARGETGTMQAAAVLEGRGEPSRIWFAGVSAGFFETLGVPPLLGRTITPEHDVPNGPGVAVLNYQMMMATFTPGASPRACRTVVGVVPDVRYRGLDEVQLDVYDPALQVGTDRRIRKRCASTMPATN